MKRDAVKQASRQEIQKQGKQAADFFSRRSSFASAAHVCSLAVFCLHSASRSGPACARRKGGREEEEEEEEEEREEEEEESERLDSSSRWAAFAVSTRLLFRSRSTKPCPPPQVGTLAKCSLPVGWFFVGACWISRFSWPVTVDRK
jgi:hypothetical protein